MAKNHNPNGIGHKSNALQNQSPTLAAMEGTFGKAYKKMRVVCQIVHNRLEFLRDNLNKARNAETEADRHEGLFEARGEINFIQALTEPLQATYHGCTGNNKGELIPADDADVSFIEEKHGKEIAEAEKLILEMDQASAIAQVMAREHNTKHGKHNDD